MRWSPGRELKRQREASRFGNLVQVGHRQDGKFTAFTDLKTLEETTLVFGSLGLVIGQEAVHFKDSWGDTFTLAQILYLNDGIPIVAWVPLVLLKTISLAPVKRNKKEKP